MASTDSSSRLRSEFDRFLFEPIGEDANGMSLSVVSALARMDLDAWHEAAALAALPAESAAQKLGALLRAFPDQSLMESDRATLVARLIALLPPAAAPRAQSPLPSNHDAAATVSKRGMSAIFLALYLIALLIFQFLMARRDPPTLGEPALQPTSLPFPAQTSPTSPVN
jgi:hypothetical protein